MGLIDFLSSKPTDRKLTKKLVNFVYDRIQNAQGIRVEDALCTMATIVGEQCIACANEFSIDEHEFDPGMVIFSEKINELLVGPVAVKTWNEVPSDSVFGTIKAKTESVFDTKDYPDIVAIFENHAKNVEHTEWGKVTLKVPEGNKPYILPIRVGYETRRFVQKDINVWSNEKSLQICIEAMVQILMDTKTVIASPVALAIAFETINGMSKMATMTDAKMKEFQNQKK